MRFQRLALMIAAGAMFLVLATAGALIVGERSDSAERSSRTAALEVSRVQAVIQARAEALAAVTQALINDPEVAQWATGGKPPAWHTGAPREAVKAPGAAIADYVIFVGPGPVVVGQQGAAAPPPFSGPNLQRAPQRSLVAEAQTGNIVRFADAPAVTASARSHQGTDAVGVAAAALLDRAELDAIGRLLGREVRLEWRPTGEAPAHAEVRVDGAHDVATGRLDQVVDGEVLVALVTLTPGQAGGGAGQRGLIIATGAAAAALGMGGILLMLRALASRLATSATRSPPASRRWATPMPSNGWRARTRWAASPPPRWTRSAGSAGGRTPLSKRRASPPPASCSGNMSSARWRRG